MVWIISFFTLAGYNFSFWLILSAIRFIYEKIPRQIKKKPGRPKKILLPSDVAAIIPARNEELSIRRTIISLLKVLPKRNIFVASDNSIDKTVKIARLLGVNALNIKPNKGKARAITYTINYYNIYKRFKLILINDADVAIDKNYLKLALPYFQDKEISCVAPHGVTRWKHYGIWQTFFIAYRIRLWRVIQVGMRFGQTWKFTNVSYIVPGSLCLYRAKVLKKIEVDAPGLVIEDFNVTFELHKKRLGKIAYSPYIFGIHQDPYNLRDYVNQIKRWDIGFWQTVKKNGIWPSLFWLSTGSFMLELTFYALFVVLVPFLLFIFLLTHFQPIIIPFLFAKLTILDLIIGVFLMDYITTIIAAFFEKKPILLSYGFFFFFLHYIDSFIHLYSIPVAFFTKSSGTWTSPKRKK